MRWPATLALAGALVGTVVGAHGSARGSAFAAEPTMFRADARHGGLYQAAGVPVLHGVKWKFRTGGAIISSPAVSGGTVYFGSSDHNLYAVDVAAGALRWKFPTHGRITSSPALAAGRIYFGSYDSTFYALDAASGTLAWKFTTGGERRFSGQHLHGAEPAAEVMPDPFDVFLSSPVVAGDTVFFGSGDGNVYALATTSGALRWKFHTGNVVHASPAVADGTLYVGSWDSYFYALDAATGRERWRFKTGEDPKISNQIGIQSSAVVADGVVYFGCRDSHLYAVDAASGARRWAFSTGDSWVISSPAVRDGRVYFATSDSGLVQALDARDGHALFSLDFKHWPFFSSPTLAGDFLYIGSHAGKVLAIDLKGRKLAWEFATDGARQNGAAYTRADGTPNYQAAAADSFYDQLIIGFDRMMSVGAVLSTPVIDGDTLYVGSWDGELYAIG
jgi:eukaryotic-like serine/threonine-protein kinase